VIFIRIDENVSHKIADVAKAIGIPQGVIFETPFSRGETGVKDIPWIGDFATRGKPTDIRIVFSADAFMYFDISERLALQDAGHVVFFVHQPWWRDLARMKQASYFFRWFERVLEIAAGASPGDQFRLPKHFDVEAPIKPLRRRGGEKPRPPRKVRAPRPAPLLDEIRKRGEAP
jgi:hypothetical protein